jgi:nucleotide-binding universal stress UspA family protein
MNIASILCPTDFSDPSRHAMQHAAAIARWYGARVIPLHVEAPSYAGVAALAGGGPAGLAAPGTEVVSGDSPADAIAEFAARSNVDLIVMGTHGAGGVRHLILGSVTERVLRKVECPVLTVPPRADATSRLPFTRLLCAVDFSASSLAAMCFACAFAGDGGARLGVLHVVDEPDEQALFVARPYDVGHHREVYERRIADHLDRVCPCAARERVRPQLQVAWGTPAAEILRAASADGTDMIVTGVGRGAPPVFGSTVDHVVRHARCPVLTVRR